MLKIEDLIKLESKRQSEYVELIASENFVSDRVLNAVGSIFTNKYAEGYPNQRYYHGCEVVDQVETIAIENLKKIFNAKFANVQPYSGSQANMAAYMAMLKPGDKILGMSLSSGGHLTHGHFVSHTGIIFEAHHYGVDKETGELNYDEILKIAKEVKPNVIVCGASAYSRIIDFAKFRKIADKVGAFLMADVAHIAGLIVAGLHSNPIEYCDVVTSTTHKTLRGPRGGVIMTNNPELANKIDRSVFPGLQGGPLVHVIAGKAIAFEEAATKEFKEYQSQVVKNMKEVENVFRTHNVKMISNGTDNHLILIDTKASFNITGTRASDLLYLANIVVNKNSIPYDELGPRVTSGIRIGSPAMTTKGFKEVHFNKLINVIVDILKNDDEDYAKSQKKTILNLLKQGEN